MQVATQVTRSHADRILGIAQSGSGACQVSAPIPSRLVAESWRRCVGDYHLDPFVLRQVDIATAGEIHRHAQALSRLLPMALAAIPELNQALRDCPHLLLLADAEGMILHRLGDLGAAETGSKAEVSPGAIWAERRQGTNGLGTSLACGRTAAVHFTDHFNADHAWLSCVSTPLRNPGGDVVGALNVTFLQKSRILYGSIVEYLLESAARRIEDLFLLSEHANDWIISLSTQAAAAGMGFNATMAVDETERIAGANTAARRLFPADYKSLAGRSLQQVFGRSLEELLRQSAPGQSASLELDGQRLFCHVRPPLRCLAAPKPSNAPPGAPGTGRPGLAGVAGQDSGLLVSLARLRRFVDRKVPILIGGETGTGKDVLARALHEESARRLKPFVAINCAALPDALIESELFGYADGAFTGANRRGYQGKIVQSSGGTLFLDEIGDMPLPMQTRLLRVLTQEEVSPLGSDRVIPVDLNVISASHRNIEEMATTGAFRADLLYRLRGVNVRLPALRDRSDKAALLQSVWDAECLALGVYPTLSKAARQSLLAYHWPGNLRELRSALRAVIISDLDGLVTAVDLPDFLCQQGPVDTVVPDSERARIVGALRRSAWCVASAARDLGMSRQAVYRAMQRHAIRSPNRADAGRSG